MNHILLRLAVFLAGALLQLPLHAQAPTPDIPEEIVVTGRLPGPPLWKVSKGDHVIWVFPHIGIVPKDMEWDSTLVERLIAQADEYIAMPRGFHGTTTSMNPITMMRALSLAKKDTHLPKGKTLIDVLPPTLYQRFSTLKAKYFPDDVEIEELTPQTARKRMQQAVLKQEGLGSILLISKEIRNLVRKNRAIRVTDPSHREIDTVKFSVLREIVEKENAENTIDRQAECLERSIAFLENDLGRVKSQANSWAQGYTEDLLFDTKLLEEDDPCMSPTQANDEQRIEMIRQEKWLVAAEAALANNKRTFAVLGIDDILAQDGLIAQLKAKGYEVSISAQ